MDTQDYKEMMKDRLFSSFDFVTPPDNLGFEPDVWAVYHRKSEKYFISRKIPLYSMNNDEYVCLVIIPDSLTVDALRKFRECAENWLFTLEVDEEHMSSLFTLALICSGLPSKDVLRELKKSRFHVDFKYALRGWADLAIMVVDVANQDVYSNPRGRQNIRNFRFLAK